MEEPQTPTPEPEERFHLGNNQKKRRRKRPKETVTQQRKRYYRERIEKGLCTFCYRKLVPNYTLCKWHLEKRRAMLGSKPWVPGGKGRPPRGILKEMNRVKRANAVRLKKSMLKMAAAQLMGENEAKPFVRAFRKRVSEARKKQEKLPEIDFLMQDKEFQRLLREESADDFAKEFARVTDLELENKDEAVGDDERVPEADGAGGGRPAGGSGD